MKRIYSAEKKVFVENFANHLKAGTLKFTTKLNGQEVPIRKFILPLSEFPELKNVRKQELVPAAKPDGTFTFIAEFTTYEEEVLMYEYIGGCPPCCAEETAIINARELNGKVTS